MRITLKKKFIILTILIGMVPLLGLFLFNQSRLNSLESTVKKSLDTSAVNLKSIKKKQ